MTSSTIKTYHPFNDPIPDVFGLAVRTWIAWIKSLFASRPVGQFRWVPNESETEIIITDQGPINAESPHYRPAIITALGPGSWTGTGLTQRLQMAPFPLDAPTVYSGMSSVNFSITCVAREGAEARRLGYYLYRLIPVFEPILQKFGLHGVTAALVIGQENPAESLVQGSSMPEWKAVTIQAPFFVKDTLIADAPGGDWAFQPMVRSITISMQTLLSS